MLGSRLFGTAFFAAICLQDPAPRRMPPMQEEMLVQQAAYDRKSEIVPNLEQMLFFYRENESPKIGSKVYKTISLSQDPVCTEDPIALDDKGALLVKEIQAALKFHNYLDLEPTGVLDAATMNAIGDYKVKNALRDSGAIDSQLVSHLSTSSAERAKLLEDVISLLEKERKLDATDSIYVNMPEFRMRYYHDDRKEFEMRVIIGNTRKNGRWKTKVQGGTLTAAKINPWWYAPSGDLTADTRDLLRKSASLRRYTEQLVDGKWGIFERGVYGTRFRQKPGPKTFTGRIAFDFKGPYGEKLHGHPDKLLFERNVRAFSHGCIRLKDEVSLFKALQRTGIANPAIDIEDMIGKTKGGEYVTQEIKFNAPVDVKILYLLAWVERGESGLRMIMPVDVYDFKSSKAKW